MAPTRKSRITAAVAAVVGLVVALAAVLPRLTPASTAAVSVPATRTGYATVTATGATLARITTTVAPDGVTVTDATVWVFGLHGSLFFHADLRIGTGTTTRCAWRSWGSVQGHSATSYHCDTHGQRGSNAAIVVSFHR
ncbi:hypothetical protein [Actinophytocola xanthii]|uniref:Uncharacterized protein n=1 Tax=Actinophytocola xanthii TaxID=1912961 RepID=A0A1Q8C2J8_9PSEU|nr:hypothetical protein [Actinophytocola xanthii]OLF08586.1 hypothetical protein BU204_34090 [Actinophytocola xanthii]